MKSKIQKEPVHILSLGAGVQSSTLALMAAAGEVTPMPQCAIFADTQAEPKSVYAWLDWLETKLPFPIRRVTFGSLLEKSLNIITSKNGKRYVNHAPPAFITDGKQSGTLTRSCTNDSKIKIIHQEIRKIRNGAPVIQWIGISQDEWVRMKPAKQKYITNVWPLVERSISRNDCIKWMEAKGFPIPPRSACSFCPYHDDAEWVRLRDTEPEAFAQAVDYEKRLQATMKQVTGFRGTPWLHPSHKPLDKVVFKPRPKAERFQTNFNFVNECVGMCGV